MAEIKIITTYNEEIIIDTRDTHINTNRMTNAELLIACIEYVTEQRKNDKFFSVKGAVILSRF